VGENERLGLGGGHTHIAHTHIAHTQREEEQAKGKHGNPVFQEHTTSQLNTEIRNFVKRKHGNPVFHEHTTSQLNTEIREFREKSTSVQCRKKQGNISTRTFPLVVPLPAAAFLPSSPGVQNCKGGGQVWVVHHTSTEVKGEGGVVV
jgi:hypothetical protein